MQYTKKAQKLLSVKISIDWGKITHLQILGDFFVYPEESIFELEHALIGTSREGAAEVVKNFKAEIIGFQPADLIELINRGFDDVETDHR